MNALVKECLRWRPVVSAGIPHATVAEDVYRGWRIPKGSIVIANTWSILHNAALYKDPFTFRPERFLGNTPEPDPGLYGAFGFGRRQAQFHLKRKNPSLQLI
jgi:cytochrome P450